MGRGGKSRKKKREISVDPDLWERFEKKVAAEGRTASAVLEELIRNYLLADLFAGLAEEKAPLMVRPVKPVGPADAGEEVWRMRNLPSI
ncbi:MAG: ribbon-helix-helix domain-containing protein [Pyrobaculum sp.]|uniref:ribbon-helix-helix domain-containing protein n=1 Tax=Pyrobaculum sp. TaxID=2004705 RepID=UPI003CA1854C